MTSNTALLTQQHIKALAGAIRKQGTPCEETAEAVLQNVCVLKKEICRYGEKEYYIPLSVKRILAKILYPEYRVSPLPSSAADPAQHPLARYGKDENGLFAESVLYFYPTASAAWPIGRPGQVRGYLESIRPDAFASEMQRLSELGSNVVGRAETRVLTLGAGLCMEFAGDLADDVEEAEADLPVELPSPIPPAEIKKRGRKPKGPTLEVVIPEDEPEEVPFGEAQPSETKTSEPLPELLCEEEPLFEEEPEKAPISYESAMSTVVAEGPYKGRTLADVLRATPGGFVKMIATETPYKREIKAIIEATPHLLTAVLKHPALKAAYEAV